jgi:heterodisulfide reductase subunit C
MGLFTRNILKIKRNILLGKDENRSDNPQKRWKTMLRIAVGQGKMTVRPVAGVLHIIVYLGFIIINLEFIEIFIDGVFGTHRFLSGILGRNNYQYFTSILEILALLTVVAVVIFFLRRNVIHVKRLSMKELNGWAKCDANWILVIEFCLMTAFFKMNAADFILQTRGIFPMGGNFPVSKILFVPIFEWVNFSDNFLIFTEKAAWWFHFVGILFFLNYLYYSKHLHILFAFPNTYFSDLNPKGQLDDLPSVTNEVKLMFDPNATSAAPSENSLPEKFGASDVADLSWVQLLNAYSCTECGRCTANCPANLTGKKLSPRKIMMSVRDRIEKVGRNIDKNGKFVEDGKQLLGDYISPEEIWACTTCNACVEACPVLINPLSVIIDLRRFLVMEQSAASPELNMMMTNIENNGAPWQFPQSDRGKWTEN